MNSKEKIAEKGERFEDVRRRLLRFGCGSRFARRRRLRDNVDSARRRRNVCFTVRWKIIHYNEGHFSNSRERRLTSLTFLLEVSFHFCRAEDEMSVSLPTGLALLPSVVCLASAATSAALSFASSTLSAALSCSSPARRIVRKRERLRRSKNLPFCSTSCLTSTSCDMLATLLSSKSVPTLTGGFRFFDFLCRFVFDFLD